MATFLIWVVEGESGPGRKTGVCVEVVSGSELLPVATFVIWEVKRSPLVEAMLSSDETKPLVLGDGLFLIDEWEE